MRIVRSWMGAAVAAGLLASPLVAAEGMWMPQQIPGLAAELKAAGMELDPERLADLLGDPLGAIVSLGGCSASFVSPEGLIVTNHHCVAGSLQFNSTPERDLLLDGFLAATRDAEIQAAPGSYVYVTTAIRDVTAEVLGDGGAGLSDADFARQVERRQRELVDTCEKDDDVRCRVANFFEGALFLEITQMQIRDVRMVYSPAEGVGNFGGEIDNWMWPRHTGDFSFLRAWVGPDGRPADPSPDNVPYRPRHWLKVATEGVEEGDLVWIAGYPGRTFRYRTAAEVAAAHEFSMPELVRWAHDMIAILETESRRGKEVELANYGRIRGLANVMKKYEGQLLAMRDGKVEAQRRAREAGLDFGDAAESPLAVLDRIQARRRQTERRDFIFDWLGRSSPMLGQAFSLWRLAEERPLPDLDREEGYRERDRSRFLQGIARAQRSMEPASDRATLRYALLEAARLPEGQRIAPLDARLAATGRDGAEAQVDALLDGLYAGTRIGDREVRMTMADESLAQLAARGDSMLDLVRDLAPLAAARRDEAKADEGAMLRHRPAYLRAIAAAAGREIYPDANSTLRFTWGVVTGYEPRDAVRYVPRTTLAGVVAKTGEDPFHTPKALLDAAATPLPAYVDPQLGSVPVGFLSTTDITGGNSGSATLNGRGELVGLAFDGNWEGVVSDFLFLDPIVRTIHVDAVYMRWVMDAVDGAHHLLREMGLPVHAAD